MSVHEVKELIAEALQAITTAQRRLDVAATAAHDALVTASAAAHDTANIGIRDGLNGAASAQQEIDATRRRLTGAAAHAETYRGRL